LTQEQKRQKELQDKKTNREKFHQQFVHNLQQLKDNLEKVSLDGEFNMLIIAQRPFMARSIANILTKEKITEFEGIHKS